ncbi:Uncharacterized protein TPAR_08839 [Tolypocladium paradoxum]|uniref:Uncharacterized protein n=1 Tax=Tolypocladium paradoxum TaxID=94208 RepID=A0A2S4KL65_9HYPO|nr:Uncharacterized protein TPAR_08839 [Tolypocladium paradoxum]
MTRLAWSIFPCDTKHGGNSGAEIDQSAGKARINELERSDVGGPIDLSCRASPARWCNLVLLPISASSTFINMITNGDDPSSSPVSAIVNTYAPVGASTFNVTGSSKLDAGRRIMVQRAVTASWVPANGMADLVRSGHPQTWIPVSSSRSCPAAQSSLLTCHEVGYFVRQPRKIKAISGN